MAKARSNGRPLTVMLMLLLTLVFGAVLPLDAPNEQLYHDHGLASRGTGGPSESTDKTGTTLSTGEQSAAWKEAVTRGGERMKELLEPKPPQSPWTQYDQLTKHGWEKTPATNSGLHKAFQKALGQSEADGGLPGALTAHEETCWQHKKHSSDGVSSNEGGKEVRYNPTGAIYVDIHWPSAGILVMRLSESPRAIVDGLPGKWKSDSFKAAGGGKAVPLGRLSDVVFLEWEYQCKQAGERPSDIKYIFRGPVNNDAAREIVTAALEKTDKTTKPKPWKERTSIPVDSPEGHAILGTANGNGVALFLSQHREQLGWKTIKSIEVFDDVPEEGKKSQPCLLFTIVDHKPTAPEQESTGRTEGHETEKRTSVKAKL